MTKVRGLGRPIRRLAGDTGGISAVEFALVAPVIMFCFLAAADLGLSIYQNAQVGNAARAGAQYAAVNGWDSGGISAAATAASKLSITVTPSTYCGCPQTSSIAQQTCGTSCSSGGTAGTYVSVSTKANYTPISPVSWGKSSVNLNATAITRIN